MTKVALSVVAVFLLALTPIRIDDLFLYLTFGRRLISLGEFGPVDPYIFTIRDYHWDLWHEWLSYLVYYLMYELGGYDGIILLRATLVATVAALILKSGLRAKLSPLTSVLILAASVYAASPRCFRDRSSFFTDLFIVVLLTLLLDPRFTARGAKAKWALPALFLVWVQLHSGYLIGWFLVGLFVLSHFLRWSGRERGQWLAVSLACALITLVNPIFIEGVAWPLRAIFAPDWGVLGQIQEFTPTLQADFLSAPYKIFLVAFMLFTVLVSAVTVRRQGWFPLAVALTMSYLGLRYTRLVAMSGFSLALVLTSGLAQLQWTWIKMQGRVVHGTAVLLAGLAIGWSFASEERGLRLLASGHPLHPAVPEQAVEFLMTLPAGNVFNEWVLGGYLAWKFDGRQKIAAHGFVSDSELVEKYIYRFSTSREGWDQIVLGNDVEYFILRRQSFEESRQAVWIKELEGPGWRRIFTDGAAVIFQRIRR